LTELNAQRFCDATPSPAEILDGKSTPIDLLERRLFDVAVIEVKAKRTASLLCPVCGRRGYCVRVCSRRSLRGGSALEEFALRWSYVARVVWSNDSIARASSWPRSAPMKGARPRPR
jgi:hypothetical protein